MPNNFRALAFVSCAAIAAASAPALAQTPASTIAFDVPAQSLGSALRSFARQSGQQVIFDGRAARGKTSRRLKGAYAVDAGLSALLEGSGLNVTRGARGVLMVGEAEPGAAGQGVRRGGPSARPFADEPPIAVAAGAPAIESRREARDSTMVEELTVIGSLIRGLTEGPSPVMIISRDQLDHTGHATVAAALAALPQNFAGTANEGLNNNGGERQGTNNHFGTGLNLRGLGPDSTLVLVNGRRLAGAGSSGEFADISTIPTAAVQRVEVLLDGASALYGSDAVGGVVNIVLKDRFEGGETRLMGGAATAGEPLEWQAAQTIGRDWSGGGAMFSYEYSQRSVLHSEDRDLTRDADLRRFGGADRRSTFAFPGNVLRADPATGTSAPFWAIPAGQSGVGLRPADFLAGAINLRNQRAAVDVLPSQRRHSVYATGHQALTDRIELSGDLRYGYRNYALESGINSGQVTVSRTNPFFVSPNAAASNSIQYAFAELPSARAEGWAESLGVSVGTEARLYGDWRAEAYAAYSREIGTAQNTGLLNTIALAEASGSSADRADTAFNPTVDGYFNPFNGQASNRPAVLAYIGGGYQKFRNRSVVETVNVKADGSVFTIPGGKVQLAVGAQRREESFRRVGENYITTAAPVAAATVDVGRTVDAAFAEVRAPLFGPDNARTGLQRLELSLAGRVERYDDFGWTRNPKVGVLWSPRGGLLLRASYGQSFRAPGLRELSDSPSNTSSLLPVGALRVGSLIQSGGNPDLNPETAKSYTAGVEWQPNADFKIGVGWFEVRFKDRIDQPVRTNIQTALSDPRVATFIRRITPVTNAADRAVIEALLADPATRTVLGGPEAYGAIVDARYVNTASLRVSGMDVNASYRREIGDDELTFSGNLTHLNHYEQRLTPTSQADDLVGVATYPVDLRARGSMDWRRGDLGAGLSLNYVSAYEDALGVKIKALATVDLRARYAAPQRSWLKGASAALNVRNLFDQNPPFYDNAAGIAYDAANGDPIGRFVSLQLTKTW